MDESETGQENRDKKRFDQDKKHSRERQDATKRKPRKTPVLQAARENPPARVAAVQLDKTTMDTIIAGVAAQLQAKEGEPSHTRGKNKN